MCLGARPAGAKRATADLPIAQLTRSSGVDCAIVRLASRPLGLGEVEDVDRALTPPVPWVVLDDLENPFRGGLEGFL